MIIFIGKKFLIMKLVKFKDLINRFDCFLFDQWGVIHNGKKKFSFIDKTLKKLNSKYCIVISNTSQNENEKHFFVNYFRNRFICKSSI